MSVSSYGPEELQILSQFWYPVAFAHQVQDHPLGVRLLERDLVVWRTAAGVQVAEDRCPHRGYRLSHGRLHQELLICPYHGFHYDFQGRCVLVPSDPTATIPTRLCLKTYPTQEAYGLVWTCLGLNPDTHKVPPFPEWGDPEYVQFLPAGVELAVSAGRQMEGFLDVAHFAWVHTQTFGDANNPLVPAYGVETTPLGLRADYWSTVSNFPQGLQHLGPPDYLWRREFEVFLPYTARLTVTFPGGGRLCILNAMSPVSPTRSRLFCPICRNFDRDAPPEPTYAFNAQVFAEDKAMVEAQVPAYVPLDPRAEVPVGADRTSVAYRQALRQLGLQVHA
ncbi:MAG: aromatic ring-hydroxylating dioxygenase subunit alpha [Thermostichales cyanobacterium SRBZ-1_bins_19]